MEVGCRLPCTRRLQLAREELLHAVNTAAERAGAATVRDVADSPPCTLCSAPPRGFTCLWVDWSGVLRVHRCRGSREALATQLSMALAAYTIAWGDPEKSVLVDIASRLSAHHVNVDPGLAARLRGELEREGAVEALREFVDAVVECSGYTLLLARAAPAEGQAQIALPAVEGLGPLQGEARALLGLEVEGEKVALYIKTVGLLAWGRIDVERVKTAYGAGVDGLRCRVTAEAAVKVSRTPPGLTLTFSLSPLAQSLASALNGSGGGRWEFTPPGDAVPASGVGVVWTRLPATATPLEGVAAWLWRG